MKKRSVMMALGLVMTLTACGGGKDVYKRQVYGRGQAGIWGPDF